MDKNNLLDRLDCNADERIVMAHILDKLVQCENRNVPTHSGFLSPREQTLAKQLLHNMGKPDGFLFHGGYWGAERCILSFLPDYMDAETFADNDNNPICAIRCTFAQGEKLTHRDFLGSLMGLGIARDTVGDILLCDNTCDILLLSDICDFARENFISAGRVKLKNTAIERWEVQMPAAEIREIRDTVATLRLDSVVSSGLSMSRSKASSLILSGKVEVNWSQCQKTDKMVAEGDCISARGYGKFDLARVGGLSKKGRITIELKRYI